MADFRFDHVVFDEAMRRYIEVSRRSPAQICNTKAYYISRKATWFTAKTSRAQISNELASRVSGSRRLSLRPGTRAGNEDAPLAALIIQKLRGEKGVKGLYGDQMTAAINELLGKRLKSLAFLRSGWLPAIRDLKALAVAGGSAPQMGDTRQFGADQGRAEPAQETDWNAVARIINHAASLSKTSRATNFAGFQKIGEEGLDRAFADETASMLQYIEDHMRPAAEEFNRRVS